MGRKPKSRLRGGSFKNRDIRSGVSELRRRDQTIIDSIKERSSRSQEYGRQQLSAMRTAGQKQQENLSQLNSLEDKKYQTRRRAILKRQKTEVEQIEGQAKEALLRGEFWGEVGSETAAEKFREAGYNLWNLSDAVRSKIAWENNEKDIEKIGDVFSGLGERIDQEGAKAADRAVTDKDKSALDHISALNSQNLHNYGKRAHQWVKENIDRFEKGLQDRAQRDKVYGRDSVANLYDKEALALIKALGLNEKHASALEIRKLYKSKSNVELQRMETNQHVGNDRTLAEQNIKTILADPSDANINQAVSQETGSYHIDGDNKLVKPGDLNNKWDRKAAFLRVSDRLLKSSRYINDWELFEDEVLDTLTIDGKKSWIERHKHDDPTKDLKTQLHETWLKLNKEHVSKGETQKKVNDRTSIIDIDKRIAVDYNGEDKLDLSDFTSDGGRQQLLKLGRSAGWNSAIGTHIDALLQYDPTKHVTRAQNETLRKAAHFGDLPEFMGIYRTLDKAERKEYLPLYENLVQFSTTGNTLKDVKSKANVEIEARMGDLNTGTNKPEPGLYVDATKQLENDFWYHWAANQGEKDSVKRYNQSWKDALESFDDFKSEAGATTGGKGIYRWTKGTDGIARFDHWTISSDDEELTTDSLRSDIDSKSVNELLGPDQKVVKKSFLNNLAISISTGSDNVLSDIGTNQNILQLSWRSGMSPTKIVNTLLESGEYGVRLPTFSDAQSVLRATSGEGYNTFSSKDAAKITFFNEVVNENIHASNLEEELAKERITPLTEEDKSDAREEFQFRKALSNLKGYENLKFDIIPMRDRIRHFAKGGHSLEHLQSSFPNIQVVEDKSGIRFEGPSSEIPYDELWKYNLVYDPDKGAFVSRTRYELNVEDLRHKDPVFYNTVRGN